MDTDEKVIDLKTPDEIMRPLDVTDDIRKKVTMLNVKVDALISMVNNLREIIENNSSR